MTAIVLLMGFLAGCDGGGTGGDSDDTDGGGSDNVTAISSTPCDSGDTDCTSGTLTAVAEQAGILDMTDVIQKNCGTTLEIAASVSGDQITVTYTETGEQADCECTHVFSYEITGLAAGEYTITAGGSTTTATVL
jgi:hypothetical protein